MPFCACRRFSASSSTTDCGPSITSSVTSSPRWAGRQCMNSASDFASAISRAFTWYRLSRLWRRAPPLSPLDTQVSVTTQSAPFTASSGSVPTTIAARGVLSPRERPRGVGDSLAAAELHVVAGERDRFAAELTHGDVEGDARAGRGPVEDHGERTARERAGARALALELRLHGAARLDHGAQLGF